MAVGKARFGFQYDKLCKFNSCPQISSSRFKGQAVLRLFVVGCWLCPLTRRCEESGSVVRKMRLIESIWYACSKGAPAVRRSVQDLFWIRRSSSCLSLGRISSYPNAPNASVPFLRLTFAGPHQSPKSASSVSPGPLTRQPITAIVIA